MAQPREVELSDTLQDAREPNSAAFILEAIDDAEQAFQPYMSFCRKVDDAYSSASALHHVDIDDEEFALFWASMEILKPAIYAKPPKPIAAPRFKDGGPAEKTTAELIERCLTSEFDRGNIDDVMIQVRDDLALTNRGAGWVTYESDEKGGGQRTCLEHLDRSDFLHEPARKWSEVGWVARRAWMTRREMKRRFEGKSGDAFESANFHNRLDKDEYGSSDKSAKAGVWEVWSKTDNRVYWVSESCSNILDEDEPHLNLRGFFPCPRPAYGTLRRRSLVPVPDYKRYMRHCDQVNELTARIYTLLAQVKLKVLIPAGGDIGTAIETALKSEDDTIVIPVPAAAMMAAGANNLMMTLPLVDIATTIQGLIDARKQLIDDFYQLSGISDIMRGATEADETLGAQQLKTQYGSVRVRDKIDELTRFARDLAVISAEILSANFSQKTLLDLSRMTIPTKAEVKSKLKETEAAAKDALQELAGEFEDQDQKMTPETPPEQIQAVQQEFQKRQQEIIQRFQPVMRQLGETVPIEDVMEMLRDHKARNLIIDIETDSTVLTDENAEKASRAEFLNAVGGALTSIAPMAAMGEEGAKLGGGILKFALQPYRANRELDALIDDFVDKSGAMGAQAGAAPEGTAELAAAQMKLAEAEVMKAQAATAKVQADGALKTQELQLRGAEAQAKAGEAQQKLTLELEKTRGAIAETDARIQKIYAEIEALGLTSQIGVAKVQNETRKTDMEEVRTVSDIQARQTDQAMNAQDRQRQAMDSERNHAMGERQQDFTERQSDRQQTFAERQAERETQTERV